MNNTESKTGLTREQIQAHAGSLIKERREELKITADDFVERVGVKTRKTLWEWESGRGWPRPRHVLHIEDMLGFRRNSLTELFRLVGSHVDITELKVRDLLEAPRAWREHRERDTLAEATDVVLVQELVRRLREKDDELVALRRENQDLREGGRRNLYDLAADDSPFKAALQKETGE